MLFLKKESYKFVFQELLIMLDGKVFQSVGAATEKDLATYVFKLK